MILIRITVLSTLTLFLSLHPYIMASRPSGYFAPEPKEEEEAKDGGATPKKGKKDKVRQCRLTSG